MNKVNVKVNKISVFLVIIFTLCVMIISCGIKNGEEKDIVTEPTATEVDSSDETEAPEIISKRISFAAVGDNIIYQAGFTDAMKRATSETGKFNFMPVYSDIQQIISEADISFINQETLMAGEQYGYSDYPRFNSPQDLGYQLVDIGFDVINIANNHMLDMGSNGLKDTIDFWNTMPVTLIGGYLNQEDFNNIRVVEKDGIKIAFLSFTYSTNGLSLPSSSELYIPYINDEDILSSIEAAKDISDMIFVSMHWGEEGSFIPSGEQRRLAQLMADNGVKVIIGHHPHVIQPIEWIEGSNNEKTLCIYSLGDLVAVMMKSYNMLGGIMTFDIVQQDDEFYIENPIFLPTVHYFGPSYYNSHIYLLEDVTPDIMSTFANVYKINDTVDDLYNYVTKTIDGEFLPDYLKQQQN